MSLAWSAPRCLPRWAAGRKCIIKIHFRLTGTLVQLGACGGEAHAEVLGTCASIRVGFIAIVLAMLLVVVLMLRVLVLMLAGRGARLVAVTGRRGNAAVEHTILCGSCACSGGSTGIATSTMWWTVRGGRRGTVAAAAILLITRTRHRCVQQTQFTCLVLLLRLLATQCDLESNRGRKLNGLDGWLCGLACLQVTHLCCHHPLSLRNERALGTHAVPPSAIAFVALQGADLQGEREKERTKMA